MRRYYIVSGILLILSIRAINFALAAPILPQEKRQARVVVVHMPKDMRSVFGKRGVEDLEKAVAEYFKTTIKTTESSDAHASSSSAQDHGSTDVGQAAPPNPASPTANPGLLMEPSGSSSTVPVSGSPDDRFNAAWDDTMSNKASDGSSGPLFTPGSSEDGLDDEWKAVLASISDPIPIPNPRPGASTDPEDKFDWNKWMDESPPKDVNAGPSTGADPDNFDWNKWMDESPPKEVNAGPSTGADTDNFDWNQWMDESPPKKVSQAYGYPNLDWNLWTDEADPLAKTPGIGLAPKYQVGHVQQPNSGPWNQGTLSPKLPTEPDSDPNSMVAHQPPPYPPSSTEFDKDYDINLPPSFAQSPTEVYSYPFLGSEAPPTSPSARLPTVPEHELARPAITDPGSGGEPENEADTPLPLELEPLEEPEQEAIAGPPTSPNPEFRLDDQSPSTGSQPVDSAALLYGMKGKAKQL